MKGNVLIHIKWADPERNGLRTLVLGDTTIDATFHRLSVVLRGNGTRHATKTSPPPPGDQPKPVQSDTARPVAVPANKGGTVAARGRNGQRAALGMESHVVPSPANGTHGEVRWINQAPAGRFGDPNTLIQIAVDDRRLLVKIAGGASLSIGTPVLLEGVASAGTFFEGEVRDTGKGVPLIIVAPTPLL